MIDLYIYGTGNGKRASIALEECGLPYTVHKIDINKGEQNTPEFRKLNPIGGIPVIVDPDGPGGKPVTISQSGAIALYCAEKTGKFLPKDPAKRLEVMQWLMHAVSDGAMTMGAIFRLSNMQEKSAAAIESFKTRLASYFKGVDTQLAANEYLAGELSIADIAFYTVVSAGKMHVPLDAYPHLDRWFKAMSSRPGVVKGMAVPA
jgi:GSH-dependent disulfide-bond oxidoreductase